MTIREDSAACHEPLLTPKLEKYVRKKVASGLYNNASEVMREALRLFVEREAVPATKGPQPLKKSGDILAKLEGFTAV